MSCFPSSQDRDQFRSRRETFIALAGWIFVATEVLLCRVESSGAAPVVQTQDRLSGRIMLLVGVAKGLVCHRVHFYAASVSMFLFSLSRASDEIHDFLVHYKRFAIVINLRTCRIL